MEKYNQYAYDFSYSINFDSLKQGALPPSQMKEEEKSFANCCKILLESECLATNQIKQFASILFRQALFREIGMKIQALAEIEFEYIGKNTKSHQNMQNLRQQLCEKIQEINTIFGNQRQKYLSLTILLLTIILVKALQRKYSQKNIQKSVLFHFVHWEMKGQHSTNLTFEYLLNTTTKTVNLNNYFQNDSLASSSVLKSFKEVSSSMNFAESSFSSRVNKQNQNGCNISICSFRKTVVSPKAQEKSLIKQKPSTFSKKLNSGDGRTYIVNALNSNKVNFPFHTHSPNANSKIVNYANNL